MITNLIRTILFFYCYNVYQRDASSVTVIALEDGIGG